MCRSIWTRVWIFGETVPSVIAYDGQSTVISLSIGAPGSCKNIGTEPAWIPNLR